MAEVWEVYIPPVGQPLALRSADAVTLRALLNPPPSATADLDLAVCLFCAFPSIVSSSDPPGTGQTTAIVGPLCTRCTTLRTQFPGLFTHIQRMIYSSRWILTSLG